jgi:hypothetical protein
LQNRLAPQRTALASASPMAAANRRRWLHERVMARPLWANLWGPGATLARAITSSAAGWAAASSPNATSMPWSSGWQPRPASTRLYRRIGCPTLTAPTRSTAVHHFRRCKPPWAMPMCRPRVAICTRGAVSSRSLWVHAIRDPIGTPAETSNRKRRGLIALRTRNLIYGTRLEFYSSDARGRVCARQT